MKRLHLICNAHLDPIWQWTWDEGISAALATFKSAADLAEEFDYVFCHGESLLYEAIEKNAPALFARIQKLVKQGKWQITSGWFLQPDCLFPAGETLVRHIAVGKAYFKEKFGVEPTVATNFDSFGHSVGLVQILAKNGYNGYLTCRPARWQFDFPAGFFKWTSPDGSSVIASQSPTYNSALGHAVEKIQSVANGETLGMLGAEAKANKEMTQTDVDYVLWGVGNHGGGPSRKDLQDIANLKIPDTEILHSTPENLFADCVQIGGEVTTSLVTCMPGCYSSMARVKQAYRRTENLFYATEKMLTSAILAGTGFTPDFAPLAEAEKKLLLSSFHDILPGTCIEEGEREGLGLLANSEKILKDYRTNAFLHLVIDQRKAEEGEFPVFVFNYLPREVTMPVEVEFSLADQNWREDVCFVPHIYTTDGEELTCQQIKEDSTLHLDWRKRIIFEGTLKPLGITRFTVKVKETPTQTRKAPSVCLEEYLHNNPLLSSPISFELYDDTADPWGMSLDELKAMGKNPVPLRLMTKQEAGEFCAVEEGIPPVRKIEDGTVYTGIECFYTLGKTNAVAQYKLYKNAPYLDLKVTVEFAEKNKLLRVKIPTPNTFANGKTVGDGPFVWEEKPPTEVAFQKWLGLKAGEEFFAVANDGVYAGKAENGYLYLTLLRGSGYCMHPIEGRELYPRDRYLPRIDCGRYTYNFRICKGSVYEVNALAEQLNLPPYAVNVFPTGEKSTCLPSVQMEGNVQLATAKPHADGSVVFRVYNPAQSQEKFTLRIGEISITSTANHGEVVTLLYDKNTLTVVENKMIV